MESCFANSDPDTDTASGEMLLSIVLLYWGLQDRLEHCEPELSKQERLFLVRLAAPRRMGDLARVMQALPSTLTALADGLEAKGLVERSRDPDDRRAWLLGLTEAGQTKRAELLDHADRALREATGLSDDDLQTFGALLLKVRNHIKADGLPKGAKI